MKAFYLSPLPNRMFPSYWALTRQNNCKHTHFNFCTVPWIISKTSKSLHQTCSVVRDVSATKDPPSITSPRPEPHCRVMLWSVTVMDLRHSAGGAEGQCQLLKVISDYWSSPAASYRTGRWMAAFGRSSLSRPTESATRPARACMSSSPLVAGCWATLKRSKVKYPARGRDLQITQTAENYQVKHFCWKHRDFGFLFIGIGEWTRLPFKLQPNTLESASLAAIRFVHGENDVINQ